MEVTRRDFLKLIVSGYAAAVMPKVLAFEEKVAAAMEVIPPPTGYETTKFFITPGSGGIGDGMLIQPPRCADPIFERPCMVFRGGLSLEEGLEKLEANRSIQIIPWRRYLTQIEAIIPDELREDWARLTHRRPWEAADPGNIEYVRAGKPVGGGKG